MGIRNEMKEILRPDLTAGRGDVDGGRGWWARMMIEGDGGWKRFRRAELGWEPGEDKEPWTVLGTEYYSVS